MRVIDLGHPITNDMTVYPGDAKTEVTPAATIEKDGYRTTDIKMTSHTGTHIDAPAHIFADGKPLDEFRNETFFGFGLVIDVRKCAGRKITLSDIKAHVKDVNFSDFLLFRTDWDKKWGTEEYLKDFPVLSKETAEWVTKQDLKGIGFDFLSADMTDSETNEIHKILLGADLVVIENMKDLDKVGEKPFCLVALPMPLVNQDGGSARVMAVLEK